MTKDKNPVGRPKKTKDFTQNMDSVMQDKEQGRRLMAIPVKDIVLEPNVRHISLWGDNYDPNNIENYDARAIQDILASMLENQAAGKPLCDTPPTVWIDEKGRALLQVGNSRTITMKMHFAEVVEQFIVADEPFTDAQKLQENTVRSVQHDVDVAVYAMRMKQSGSKIPAIAAACSKKQGWVVKWLDTVEHCSPTILGYIRSGRIKEAAIPALLGDVKLQELVCDMMYSDPSIELASPVSVLSLLQRFQEVKCAIDLLPFMEGHEEYLKDVVYIKRDGVYCDIYILDEATYKIWYEKAVFEPQVRKACHWNKETTLEVLRNTYSDCKFKEPICISDIPHGKTWLAGQPINNMIYGYIQPYIYRHQFGYLTDDVIVKVGTQYTEAKTKLAESVPKEEVLRELRCDFADEAIHIASDQTLCDVLATQIGLPYGLTVEKFLHRLTMSFQRKLSEAALEVLVNGSGKDWEEIYAAAEQRVRDTRHAKNAKKMEAAEAVFEYYAYLWFPYDTVDVMLPKKKSSDETEYSHHDIQFALDWNDLESVWTFFVQDYDYKNEGDIFRKCKIAAKKLGAKVEWNSRTEGGKVQSWVQEVKALMMRLESKFPLEVSEAKMRASQNYDERVFEQEAKRDEESNLSNILIDNDQAIKAQHPETVDEIQVAYDRGEAPAEDYDDDYSDDEIDMEALAEEQLEQDDLFDDMETGGEDEGYQINSYETSSDEVREDEGYEDNRDDYDPSDDRSDEQREDDRQANIHYQQMMKEEESDK